jgi:hypothetical protein
MEIKSCGISAWSKKKKKKVQVLRIIPAKPAARSPIKYPNYACNLHDPCDVATFPADSAAPCSPEVTEDAWIETPRARNSRTSRLLVSAGRKQSGLG